MTDFSDQLMKIMNDNKEDIIRKTKNLESRCLLESKVNEYINNTISSIHDMEGECTRKVKTLLEFIFKNIRYVSFQEFLDKLTKYLNVILNEYKDLEEYNIYFITGEDEKDIQETIFMAILINNILEANDKYKEKYKISGFYKKCPDFFDAVLDYIYLISRGFLKNTDILVEEGYTIYLLVPFISSKVRYLKPEIFSKRDNSINVIESCIEIVPTFTEICANKNFDIFSNDIYLIWKETHDSKKIHYSDKKSGNDSLSSFLLQYLYQKSNDKFILEHYLIFFDHIIYDSQHMNSNFLTKCKYIDDNIIIQTDDSYLNGLFIKYLKEVENFKARKKHGRRNFNRLFKYTYKYTSNELGNLDNSSSYIFKNRDSNIIYKVDNNKESVCLVYDKDLNSLPIYKSLYNNDQKGGYYYDKYMKMKKQYIKLRK